MSNIAVMLDLAGTKEEASKLQTVALGITRRVLPPEHPCLATALSNPGCF